MFFSAISNCIVKAETEVSYGKEALSDTCRTKNWLLAGSFRVLCRTVVSGLFLKREISLWSAILLKLKPGHLRFCHTWSHNLPCKCGLFHLFPLPTAVFLVPFSLLHPSPAAPVKVYHPRTKSNHTTVLLKNT